MTAKITLLSTGIQTYFGIPNSIHIKAYTKIFVNPLFK